MIGIGFALFAGTLVDANRSLPFTVGLALSPVAAAVLAHLVLAFPDGRLHSGLERFLVVSGVRQRDSGSDHDAHVHGHRARRRLPLPEESPVRS